MIIYQMHNDNTRGYDSSLFIFRTMKPTSNHLGIGSLWNSEYKDYGQHNLVNMLEEITNLKIHIEEIK